MRRSTPARLALHLREGSLKLRKTLHTLIVDEVPALLCARCAAASCAVDGPIRTRRPRRRSGFFFSFARFRLPFPFPTVSPLGLRCESDRACAAGGSDLLVRVRPAAGYATRLAATRFIATAVWAVAGDAIGLSRST
jgi:hypothetical protein